MSYLGRGIDQIDNISTLDNLSFNGSDATFNLTQNGVAFVPVSADALQIQIDGIIQSGNFSVSSSTVTFDFTPSGSSVCNGIKHFGVGVMTSVSDGAITNVKLGADSVNGSKIADNSIDSEHYVDGSIDLAHMSSDSVNESKLQVSNSPTNGYMLTAQSGNTGGLTWAEAGSGTFVKVGDVRSNAAASSFSLTGIFSDTYDKYFFSLSTFPSVANNAIQFRFLDGSNNDISTGYYGASWGRNQSNSNPSHAHNGHDNIALSNGHSNGRAFQCQGYIIGPTSGIGSNKQVMWHANQWDNVNVFETQVGGYTNVSATDYTGMKIKSNSDNLTAISLQVYGIVDTKHYNGS